jgi:hypothetical protein
MFIFWVETMKTGASSTFQQDCRTCSHKSKFRYKIILLQIETLDFLNCDFYSVIIITLANEVGVTINIIVRRYPKGLLVFRLSRAQVGRFGIKCINQPGCLDVAYMSARLQQRNLTLRLLSIYDWAGLFSALKKDGPIS